MKDSRVHRIPSNRGNGIGSPSFRGGEEVLNGFIEFF
jgi:hypothetical protein